jgi:hypothetical protein
MNIPARLLRKTFVIQHNPNCPSPFLVRLVSPRKGSLDMGCVGRTDDVIGYGKDVYRAARQALFNLGVLEAQTKA